MPDVLENPSQSTSNALTTPQRIASPVVPNPTSFATAVFTDLINDTPYAGHEPKPFAPGMTEREKIEQLSREDPLYGSMIKQIETGRAHSQMIFYGADPYTGYAASHLAREAKQQAPGVFQRLWSWMTDRSGTRGGSVMARDDD